MTKNTDIYTINILNVKIDKLMKNFIAGVSIIFVVKEGKLLGAVTEGDIYRFFNNVKKTTQFKELFNADIKRIVYNDDKQVYKDAKVIFDSNEKIYNIPVVDKTGKLLFQIDRFRDNINLSNIKKNILEAAKNGSIEYFLNSCSNSKIVLTGANCNLLYETERVFYKYYSKLIIHRGISINIAEDIDDSCIIDSKARIISLSRLGFTYLCKYKNIKADIITSHELVSFFCLKDIYNFDKEVIEAFMNIFSYKAIAFYPLNKNIESFIELIKKYGLKIYNLCDKSLFNINNDKHITSVLNIFLISGNNEEYIEEIVVTDLIQIIKYIKRYKQLEGNFLKYNTFMRKCIKHLLDMEKRGVRGFLCKPVSYWKVELCKNIKSKSNLEIIDKWEDTKVGNKYFIDKESFHRQLPGSEISAIKTHCLRYACEFALYSHSI